MKLKIRFYRLVPNTDGCAFDFVDITTDIEEMSARCAALEKDRDSWKAAHDADFSKLQTTINKLMVQRDAMEAQAASDSNRRLAAEQRVKELRRNWPS